MINKQEYLKHILLFTLIAVLGTYMINSIKNNMVLNHLKIQDTLLKSQFDTNYKYFKLMSADIYMMIKENEKVIDILSKVSSSKPKDQDILREKLYKLLIKRYKHLKNMGVQQLQFHLPDDISFLRMNAPKRYGDTLSGFRRTVVNANKTLKPTEGFEFGRKVYGFRFVYPLFDIKHNHIGSMEVSYSVQQMMNILDIEDLKDSNFLVSKKLVQDLIWDYKKLGNFNISKVNKEFYHDISIHNFNLKKEDYEKIITNKITLDINEKMGSDIPFSLKTIYKNKTLIISFLPFKDNFTNKTIAYLNTYVESKYLDDLNMKIYYIKLLFFVVLFIIFMFGILIIKNKQELEQEKFYINKILNTNPSITIVTSGEKIISANKSFFDLFKYKSVSDFLKEHDCICDYFLTLNNKKFPKSKIVEGKIWAEYIIEHSEQDHIVKADIYDEIYFFKLNASRLSKKEILVIMTDITDLKKQEEQLFKSEKLASMGEMIGNIAHQWRQPLSIISTAATGIKIQTEYNNIDQKELFELCDSINEHAQYLSKTIDDFRGFIKGDTKPVDFDLKNDTNNFIKLVNSSIKEYNLKLITQLDDNIRINGYPNELIQCFINIFNNAKDALIDNNEEERYIFITEYKKDAHAVIEFKDNARGIKKDILDKIFDPYFTTKHKSQGTGLGLHMTYNLIVNGMNGNIKVENTEYTHNDKTYLGAKFTITIPLSRN